MLITEILDNGLILTKSDLNKYIKQIETGIEYEEALDIQNKYTYIETDRDIETKVDEVIS